MEMMKKEKKMREKRKRGEGDKKQGVSKRNADVLVWIAEQYTVNLRHLQAVVNAHPHTRQPLSYAGVRTLFWRLREAGYVEWKRLVRQRPNFVYVTPKTLEELELPFVDYVPQAYQKLPDGKSQGTTTIHKDQINAVRIALEWQYGNRLGWMSERWLKLEQAPYADGRYPHRLDGLIFAHEQPTAIEVERARKGTKRLERIMLELMATYPRIHYYCTQPQTYGVALQVASELDPRGRYFQIFDCTHAI